MVIKHKIGLLGIVPILTLVLIVVFSWQMMNYTADQFDNVVNQKFVLLIDEDVTPLINENLLPLINEDIKCLNEKRNSICLMLEADRDAHQALIAENGAIGASGDVFAAADEANAENIGQIETRMTKAAEAFRSDESKKLYGEFERLLAEWRKESREVVKMAGNSGQNDPALLSSHVEAAAETFAEMRDRIDQLQGVMYAEIETSLQHIEAKKADVLEKERSIAAHKAESIEVAEAVEKTLGDTVSAFVIAGVLCVFVVAALAYLFSRSILRPLRGIIGRLSTGSIQISNSAGQASSASHSLAGGTTEQAAGLQQTSASLEEAASVTKQNADNAFQANALAEEARKAAENGAEAMKRMSAAIDDIQKSSDETAKIIKVIDEIAFQTNLLALNAAVEAARAGEAGKGFAVVADEVRTLAMRSAEAARNTSGLIEESAKNSRNGVEISAEVGKALEEIVESISKTTDLVAEISAANKEQSEGIDQINCAVTQMDLVTQQNAANAEESASASEEINSQAVEMLGVVQDLVSMVGDLKKGSARTTAEPAVDESVHSVSA